MEWPHVVFAQQTVSSFEPWSTLAGVLVGGVITFGTTLYFQYRTHKKEDAREEDLRADAIYATYLKVMLVLNETYSLREMYAAFLDAPSVDLNAVHMMPATPQAASQFPQFSGEDLKVLRGDRVEGLNHDLVQLVHLANLIGRLTETYSNKRTRLTERMLDIGDFNPITNMIDAKIMLPRDKVIVAEIEALKALAKTLLEYFLMFDDLRKQVTDKVNLFTSTDSNPRVRRLKIIWDFDVKDPH